MNKREWMLQAALEVIRTGREFDIEQTVAALSTTYDAIVAATPTEADGGWIEHRGEKPYPEGMVEYVCRNGESTTANSDDLIWAHDQEEFDIVRYRYV